MTGIVFVVAPFRSGSTAVWSACRTLQGVTAFYEPLHERLPTLVESPVDVDPSHEGVTDDYFAEYRGIDADWLRAAHAAAAAHSHTDLLASDARQDLRAYVDGLVAGVDGTAVLQFNRLCLAIPALAEMWPEATIIAVTRPAADRLASARDQAGQAFDWYEAKAMDGCASSLATKAMARVPRLATVAARSAPSWFRARATDAQARFEADAERHAFAVFEHASLRDNLPLRLAATIGPALETVDA